MSKIILIATAFALVSLLFALVPLFDTNLFCVKVSPTDSGRDFEFTWTGFKFEGEFFSYNSDQWREIMKEARKLNISTVDITLPLTTANVLESIGAGMLGLALLLIFLLLFWPERIGLKRSAFGFSVVGFIFLLAAAVTFQANWDDIMTTVNNLIKIIFRGEIVLLPSVKLCRDAIFLWTSVGTSLLTAIVMIFVVRA
jgi:hypothetical protein